MRVLLTRLVHNEHSIDVFIERKLMRNAYARYRDDCIYVTCGYLFNEKNVLDLANTLFERIVRKGTLDRESAIGTDYYYLFGEKKERRTDLNDKRLDALLKRELKKYLDEKVRYYESVMEISSPYLIRIRKMKTRYGTNARGTHTLTFSAVLAHYSLAIIDGVIVHELTHYYQTNHSQLFYNELRKYYPDYKRYDRLLKKGIFHE